MDKVYIDSACDIYYSSFYIKGIQQVFGKSTIQFCSDYFLPFKHNNQFFCFVVKKKDNLKKIAIDFGDGTSINHDAYQWSDVYAKINILEEDYKRYEKLHSIGPGFGIHLYSKGATVYYAITNLLKSKGRIGNVKKFLADYKAQYKRPQIEQYLSNIESRKDYIYFSSSLWKKEAETNAFRANFMRAAQSINQITFEGGFAPRTNRDMEGYEALTMESRTKMHDYLARTKLSLAVFNTPAVLKCHGWKLGEFLALGKAIISTPISRVLPEKLVDGVHFLQTDGTENDMRGKLNMLLADLELCAALEENARAYFLKNLAPDKVISGILERVGKGKG